MRLSFQVTGTPAPQGSKTAFVHNGRAALTESSKRVRPWRQDVKAAALAAAHVDGWTTATGPVHLDVWFRLPRPRSHYGTGRNAGRLKPNAPSLVAKRPDLDKLLRSTLDALGEAGLWRDDAQVASLTACKRYADTIPPGALVIIDANAVGP